MNKRRNTTILVLAVVTLLPMWVHSAQAREATATKWYACYHTVTDIESATGYSVVTS